MANITVTTSGNSINIDFGDYAGLENILAKERSYDKRDIVELERPHSDDHVHILMRDAHGKRNWYITMDPTYSGDEYFIVDTIDEVTPVDNSDLYNILQTLRG